jgi:hypothetical protein
MRVELLKRRVLEVPKIEVINSQIVNQEVSDIQKLLGNLHRLGNSGITRKVDNIVGVW